MSHPSVTDAAPALPAHLHVRAGGVVLALARELLAEVRLAGKLTPIPGAPAWLAGLTQRKGRLMTVVDAGRLFGQATWSGKFVITLKGLPCELALGVDSLPGSPADGEQAERTLDAALLASHPAFQRGAAGPGGGA